MHDPQPYDRIRAYAEGTLSPVDAACFEADLAADPELRLAAEEYRAVHRLTEAALPPAPASRVTFEDVWRRVEAGASGEARGRAARLGWVAGLAVAAAVLVAALVAGREPAAPPATSPPAEGGPVLLRAIPWEEATVSGRPELPASLAGYRPVASGRIQWFESRGVAQAVAAWTGRPILAYTAFASCPLCREMDRSTLRDRGVFDVVLRCVPLRVDAGALEERALADVFAKGWPYFALERADGSEVGSFPGWRDGTGFRERLAEALDEAGVPPDAAPWDLVSAAAARTALRAARDAVARAALPGELVPATAAALRDLESLAARLAGSPVADDLERVLARWGADGRFPDLAEAKR